MRRRLGVLILVAAVGAVVAPLPAAGRTAPAQPARAGLEAPAEWRGDVVLRDRTGDRLDVPSAGAPDSGPLRGRMAKAPARNRYALSYVVIPIKGTRLGFSKAKVKSMSRRVGARMSVQTDQRYSFGFAAYSKAPAVRASRLSCDLDVIDALYRRDAKYRRQPPPGYRDTIVVYLTPPRFACGFAGVAYLGSGRVYLNGLTLNDPRRLQDWITAHELGHTLGLDHSASFWLRYPDWSPDRLIPASSSAQHYAEYGDYLDLMGQPPRGGWRLRGARFGKWLLDGPNLVQLGVLRTTNAPTVRTTGNYVINRLTPSRTGGRMVIALPVRANGSRTFWVLEYRPVGLNQAALRYPAPWSTRAYGVRLVLAGHGRRHSTMLNKTFHRSDRDNAYGTLPVGADIRLGGGIVVRVDSVDAASASVSVRFG